MKVKMQRLSLWGYQHYLLGKAPNHRYLKTQTSRCMADMGSSGDGDDRLGVGVSEYDAQTSIRVVMGDCVSQREEGTAK